MRDIVIKRSPLQLFKRLAATATACLLLSCCSQPRLQANLPQLQPDSAQPWAEAIERTTKHYRVVTNSDELTAKRIGTLLEALYATCEEFLGPAKEQNGLLNVYAFANRKLYEEQIKTLKLSPGISSGIYSPADPAGIYLPLTETRQTHPFFTLVHEGVHQYLHQATSLPLDGSRSRLPSVPLWLSEGLALYFEAALVDAYHLQPGRLHSPRLKHLQRLFKRGKAPEVKTVLGTTYGEAFGNAGYSVAWGLVYALMQDNTNDRDWLAFWEAWQESIRREAASFTEARTARSTRDLLDLQKEWAGQLSKLSVQHFQEEVIRSEESWSRWQEGWQSTILQLTSGQ